MIGSIPACIYDTHIEGPLFRYSGGRMTTGDEGPEDCYKQCQKQGLTKHAAKNSWDLVVGIMAKAICLCGFDSTTYVDGNSKWKIGFEFELLV